MTNRRPSVISRIGRLLVAAGVVLLVAAMAGTASAAGQSVTVLTADGVIDDALAGYLADSVASAAASGAEAVVVQLNTPGGSLDSTQRITSAFLESTVPVIVCVTPSGGRAASAATLDEVFAQANGRQVTVHGGQTVTLDLTTPVVTEAPMNPLTAFLHTLSDPNIAFLLFITGVLLIAVEFIHPNLITGVLGAFA